MNLTLDLLRIYVPERFKREKLEALIAATANAFGCEVMDTEGLTYRECLRAYALFTRDQVENATRTGKDLHEIQDRLYLNAYQIGTELRQMLGPSSMDDVMKIARVLYGAIGIDFHGTAQGDIVIKQCFFSSIYSGQVCRVISSLDSGVMAGLAGGGELLFSERITEGSDRCAACLIRNGVRHEESDCRRFGRWRGHSCQAVTGLI